MNEDKYVERRKGPWDRRIPNMPSYVGYALQFLYKTKKRFWSIVAIMGMCWLWIISGISIWLYVHILLNVQ